MQLNSRKKRCWERAKTGRDSPTLLCQLSVTEQERVCAKGKKDNVTALESCVSVQSDHGPRRLGEVDGWTPARSTAITLSLSQGTTLHTLCICTLKTHTKSTLSSWHARVETAPCARWEEWMVMIAPERKTYRQTSTKSLRSVFNV